MIHNDHLQDLSNQILFTTDNAKIVCFVRGGTSARNYCILGHFKSNYAKLAIRDIAQLTKLFIIFMLSQIGRKRLGVSGRPFKSARLNHHKRP